MIVDDGMQLEAIKPAFLTVACVSTPTTGSLTHRPRSLVACPSTDWQWFAVDHVNGFVVQMGKAER